MPSHRGCGRGKQRDYHKLQRVLLSLSYAPNHFLPCIILVLPDYLGGRDPYTPSTWTIAPCSVRVWWMDGKKIECMDWTCPKVIVKMLTQEGLKKVLPVVTLTEAASLWSSRMASSQDKTRGNSTGLSNRCQSWVTGSSETDVITMVID